MKKVLLCFFIGFLMVSCVSYKNTVYLQNKLGASDNEMTNKKIPYKISPNDLLQITVLSTNTQISEFFNLKAEGQNAYSVNDSGYIYMPVLDSIQVSGKTIPEIQGLVGKLIKEHIRDAIVIVRLAKFNVTVLGEVGSQGSISTSAEELTIIEAIGLAGGISDYGNKKKVELIRKEGNVTRFIKLDLTDRRIVSSEFFFLQPNDILYVEPLRAKNIRTNVGQISLFIGIASFILILNNYLKIF
jgi:polysaccharide export outer membrane protein